MDSAERIADGSPVDWDAEAESLDPAWTIVDLRQREVGMGVAQVAHQRACIDARNHRDAVAGQELLRRFIRAPVTG